MTISLLRDFLSVEIYFPRKTCTRVIVEKSEIRNKIKSVGEGITFCKIIENMEIANAEKRNIYKNILRLDFKK